MRNNLISIITPSYNASKFIAKCIDSVIAQTYQKWEMIIVDDCSPDNSNAIIEKYMQKESRIRLIKLAKNSGAAVARNRAIQEAKGRYIAFLDSDDLWYQEKLEKQLRFMQEHAIALSYTAYSSIDESTGEVIREIAIPSQVDYTQLLKQNSIGCLTAMYDTHILGKVMMPIIRKRQDFALWLTILKEVPYAYGLDEVLAYYRVRGHSVSSNKIEASLYNWKLYREIEKLPLHKALYYFSWYTYKSILKYR